MIVQRVLIGLVVAGVGVVGDMMSVWIPGRLGYYYDYPTLEGSLVHLNDSATVVTLNCRYSRTELACADIQGVTFTFGPTTAGYNFARNSTVDDEYRATAESQTCKVRNRTPFDCDGSWTDYEATRTTIDTWQLGYSYSVYYSVHAYITGYSSSRWPAITTPHSTITPTYLSSPTPTPTSQSTENDDSGEINKPVIAGAVVGSVAGVALIGLVMIMLVRRRRDAFHLYDSRGRTGSDLPTYTPANNDTTEHVREGLVPPPPTYEAAIKTRQK